MMQTEARIQQRQTALQEANRIRSARKAIKAHLASGELELADHGLDPPDEVLTASIGEVLLWQPGIGTFRASKILAGGPNSPGVGRGVKMEHLSASTRRRLCERLELHAPIRVAA
jgi:hypothetical protein